MANHLHLRFPFDANDRAVIGASLDNLTAAEVPLRPVPKPDEVPSESLLVSFPVPSPVPSPIPQVRPIFSGQITFLLDPAQVALVPQPDAISFAPDGTLSLATFSRLPRIGMLLVQLPANQEKYIKELAIPALGCSPMYAWYGPVEITREFIDTSLLGANGIARAPLQSGPRIIAAADADWKQHALSQFLTGYYQPTLRLGKAEDGSADDAVRLPMFRVVKNAASGLFSLAITLAWRREPRPGQPRGNPRDRADALHEIVPTRLFMQHVRKEFVGGKDADPVIDKIVAASAAESSTRWHANLARSLHTRGFAFGQIDQHDNVELARLLLAIRELQIYAAGRRLCEPKDAAEPVSVLDLRGRANLDPYTGALSGFANQATRRTLGLWTERRFRCPVIVNAYASATLDNEGFPRDVTTTAAENIWRYDEIDDIGPRMFAIDFSGEIRQPPLDRITSPQELTPLGWTFKDDGRGFLGPVSLRPGADKNFTPFAAAEVKPDRLFGWTETQLLTPITNDRQREDLRLALGSTFRVIRAVSEMENYGYFDTLNAYDNAHLSVSLYHWSGFDIPRPCELCGLVDYLEYLDRSGQISDAWAANFGRMGLGAVPEKEKSADGSKRTMAILGLAAESGNFKKIEKTQRKYLSSWHVFGRCIAAGRYQVPFIRATWHHARRRIRNILGTEWSAGARAPGERRMIGEALTSELLVAVIVRWHVFMPGQVIRNGIANPKFYSLYGAALAEAGGHNDAFEVALFDKIKAHVKDVGDLADQMDQMRRPPWIRTGADGKPEIGANNQRNYTLSPDLRVLAERADSFKGAFSDKLEPPST